MVEPLFLGKVNDWAAFLKLKTAKEQETWIDELNKLPNIEAKVCYGSEEAIQFILSFN